MIYLDHAATSLTRPPEVLQAMMTLMQEYAANPGRSAHRLSIDAGRIVFGARSALAELLGVDDPLRIVFTKNATEALNTIILGSVETGDHVVTTQVEHNSVIRPLRHLESEGVGLEIAQCEPDGTIDPSQIAKCLRRQTKLVVITHASNVLGTINPIEEIAEIVHAHGALLCVDGAQTSGTLPIDLDSIGVDLFAFTGHKGLLGPTGTGGFVLGKRAAQAVRPLIRGGTGSRSESEYQPEFAPDKFESGTPNTVGLAGLEAGVRYLAKCGVEQIRKRERHLTQRLYQGLADIDGIALYGPPCSIERVALVSFNLANVTCSQMAMDLQERADVLCRPGLHCSPLAHKVAGTFPSGSVRFSLGAFTTEQEVDTSIAIVREIAAEQR